MNSSVRQDVANKSALMRVGAENWTCLQLTDLLLLSSFLHADYSLGR